MQDKSPAGQALTKKRTVAQKQKLGAAKQTGRTANTLPGL
jgi:hypothetical protein